MSAFFYIAFEEGMSLKPYVKIPLKVITYLIVALAVILAMMIAGVRIFNIQIYTVLSGSMEPEYPTGSLIYVKPVDPYTLEEQDVITFRLTGDTTATHRIIKVVRNDTTDELIGFITKGDANEIADGDKPLSVDKVIGAPVFVIPKMGYLATYIQSPPGCYYTIAVGVAAALMVTVIDYFTSNNNKNKKRKKDTESDVDSECKNSD